MSAAKATRTAGGTGWAVAVSFTPSGSAKLHDLTTHVAARPPGRNRLAVVVDGVVVSAPTVQTPSDGGLVIAGGFDRRTALQLADRIAR